MEALEIFEMLASGESFIKAMESMLKTAGIVALIFALLFGFIFFLPLIIASLRCIKWKITVCILNVFSILLLFKGVIAPLLAWLILLTISITCKTEKRYKTELPNIQIMVGQNEQNK